MLNIAQRPLSKTKPKQHTRDDGGKQFRYPKRMPYARCLKQVRHKKRYGKNGDIPKQRYYQRRHAFAQRLERAADDNGDRRNDKPGAYDAQGDRSLFHCLRSIGKYVHQLLGNRKTEDRAYYHHAQAEQQCYFEYADNSVFPSRTKVIAN